MTRLTTRKLLVFTVLAVLTFFAMKAILPFSVLTELLNGVFLGLLGAVCIVFAPLFWRAIRDREFDRVSQLTLGIVLNLAALFIMRSLSAVSRAVGNDFLTNSPWPAFAAYLAILGSVLHITAPGMVNQKLRHNRTILLAAFVSGAAIAAITIYFQRQG